MNILLTDMDEDTIAAINEQLPEPASRGRQSGRNGWVKHLLAIHALGPETALAVLTLEQCALRIALLQRGERTLRESSTVRGKFLAEYAEFDAAVLAYERGERDRLAVLYRLASIVYYNTQTFLIDHDIRDWQEVMRYCCQRAGVSQREALAAAVAKFALRARRK